jgi:hypothetical protein
MSKKRAVQPGIAFASVSPREWTERASQIWPHTSKRADYICRAYRDELIAAGALVRVGRELVVRLEAYDRWLAKRARMVADYDVPANREEYAGKRFGRAAEQ